MGSEHAAALAEIGFNIILIDINKKSLTQKSKILEKDFPNTKIYSFICDITSENKVKKLSNFLKKKDISIEILINNADINPKMDKKRENFTGRVEDYKIRIQE